MRWGESPLDGSSPRRATGRWLGTLRSGALFAALALVPDVDLLLNQHQGPTHSLGAAVIAGLAVGAITRQGRLGVAAACAYASHVFLDWLGADTAPPFGVMALWPVSREHYLSRAGPVPRGLAPLSARDSGRST